LKNSILTKTNWETILHKYGNKQWNIEALIVEMKQLRGENGSKFMKRFKKKELA
jgi:hypothetical protein